MAPPIVKRFLIALDEHKLLGFFIFALVVGASGLLALQPPPPPPQPVFKATGRLAYSVPPPAFTSTGEELQRSGRQVTPEFLLSPKVLEQAKAKLDLKNQELQRIINQKLIIEFPKPEDTSQLITLNYYEPAGAEQARNILEVFMNEMIEYSRWVNTSQLRTRIGALEERLGQVQQDLIGAEEAFYRYISTEGSSLLAIQDGSLFSGITNSQRQQGELRVALQGIEAEINTLMAQLGLTPDQAYTSAALSADPIIANLRAEILANEMQLERLGQDLRPEHPTMQELRKQQQVNNKLLQARAAEVIGGDNILVPLPEQIRKESNLDPVRQELANRLVALQSQRENLLQQLQAVRNTEQNLRQQYEQFPGKQVKQAQLVQAVESQRILYQTILAALTDARSAEAETDSSLTIQQPVGPPLLERVAPNEKNLLIYIGAGTGLGLAAAAGTIFLLATLDDRLHTPKEIRQILADRDVPLLGQLPFILSFNEDGQETPVLVDTDSTYLPFYERFRSNLRRLGPETKVVIITSVSGEEGKSVSAYNLAIASAHAGKRTLLVEADLRSDSGARALGIEPDPEAKLEPLRYYETRSESIELVPEIENLYILPSPGLQRQAAAIVESSELQRVLKDARGRFDLVVVDTPSLSRCNDALLLEPLSDGMVLVTRPGFTRGSLLGETIDQFVEAELPLLGTIINDVEDLDVLPELPPSGEAEPSEPVAQPASV